MRSIEYLIQLYPDKTGKELLEIQEQDKLEDQKIFEKANKRLLAFLDDISVNGGYFRGRFGLDQYYYYHVYNTSIDKDGNTMSVDKIVLFVNIDGHKNIVTRPGELSLKREFCEYAKFREYGLESEERVTSKEWDAINNYMDNMSKLFW